MFFFLKAVITYKIVKINIFRNVEISQRHSITCMLFIQENWLNLDNNSEFCVIVTSPSLMILHQPHSSSENQCSASLLKATA